MKKVKILAHPAQIATIKLDDLDYDIHDVAEEKRVRLQVRKWRQLRQGLDTS
jgi:hypothetical protein